MRAARQIDISLHCNGQGFPWGYVGLVGGHLIEMIRLPTFRKSPAQVPISADSWRRSGKSFMDFVGQSGCMNCSNNSFDHAGVFKTGNLNATSCIALCDGSGACICISEVEALETTDVRIVRGFGQ